MVTAPRPALGILNSIKSVWQLASIREAVNFVLGLQEGCIQVTGGEQFLDLLYGCMMKTKYDIKFVKTLTCCHDTLHPAAASRGGMEGGGDEPSHRSVLAWPHRAAPLCTLQSRDDS